MHLKKKKKNQSVLEIKVKEMEKEENAPSRLFLHTGTKNSLIVELQQNSTQVNTQFLL